MTVSHRLWNAGTRRRFRRLGHTRVFLQFQPGLPPGIAQIRAGERESGGENMRRFLKLAAAGVFWPHRLDRRAKPAGPGDFLHVRFTRSTASRADRFQ
jgi:hypothetical protein